MLVFSTHPKRSVSSRQVKEKQVNTLLLTRLAFRSLKATYSAKTRNSFSFSRATRTKFVSARTLHTSWQQQMPNFRGPAHCSTRHCHCSTLSIVGNQLKQTTHSSHGGVALFELMMDEENNWFETEEEVLLLSAIAQEIKKKQLEHTISGKLICNFYNGRH